MVSETYYVIFMYITLNGELRALILVKLTGFMQE